MTARFPFACVFLCSLVACQSPAPKKSVAGRPAATTDMPDEVSLRADRSQYDDLRKDIPDEVKRENDELAYTRQLMAQGEEDPGKIRDRWSKALRDRRDKFDRGMRKRRDEFNKKERHAREEFLRNLKAARENFTHENSKAKPEKRKEFFDEQDSQRQDFFNDERDSRRDFESQMTEERRSFEAYVLERGNQFNQEVRDYSTAYYDRKRQLDIKKRADEKAKTLANPPPAEKSGPPPMHPELDEFKALQTTPATPLSPPDN